MSQLPLNHPSSYRDPSGFIFEQEGSIYRQVNIGFREHFDPFIKDGCYEHLTAKGLLIPHVVADIPGFGLNAYQVLKPERISFISYSYEWSFEMLRDAALLTLQILKEALNFGFILKDATPFNVQWHKGKLIFIDSLSFEKYKEEEPWIAYRQFCESFLSPMILMHYSQHPLQRLSLAYPEGIPLPVTKSLLPRRSKFSVHTYLHIHLHAGMSEKKKGGPRRAVHFSKQKLLNLVMSLESLVKKLKAPEPTTAWSAYYAEASQRDDYLEQKTAIIKNWINQAGPIKTGADLGANDGVFSKLLAEKGIATVAADQDPICIDHLYRQLKQSPDPNLQPLIIDLADPSPSIGVNSSERDSFIKRMDVDLAMGLALIHHLSIGRNIPFSMVAKFFSSVCRQLIIEYVPKDDPKVKEMLEQKKDIYTDYNPEQFESAFREYFTIKESRNVPGTGRTLYWMDRKQA